MATRGDNGSGGHRRHHDRAEADPRLIIVTGFAPNHATLTRKLAAAKDPRPVITPTKPLRMAVL